MKLRYKAQQMLKKTKNSKFAFDNDDNSDDDIKLTHKGKEINDNNSEMSEINDNNDKDDEYYEKMNEFIENMDTKKLSKQEKFKAIIQNRKKRNTRKNRNKRKNRKKII